MLETMVKQMLPLLKNEVKKIDAIIAKSLSEVDLLEHETQAAYFIVTDKNKVAYVLLVTVNADDTICRLIHKEKLQDFISNKISKI